MAATVGDRAAFVVQLVREEYREQTENGDFSVVPMLVVQIDGVRTALDGADTRAQWLSAALAELRSAIARPAPARTVARTCTRIAAEIPARGIPLRAPTARPDLERGASLYQTACTPCHGPPPGPPPPSAARMVPPPPRPIEGTLTPYELVGRITYGSVPGTAMPSLAETLPETDRWDIAFFLFADRWFPCSSRQWPALAAATLAHMSDYDIWKAHGWGAAACLRRDFR